MTHYTNHMSNWTDQISNWKQATKELRQAGIRVNVSINSCCMGCAELPNLDPSQPAMYSLTSRFTSYGGGIVYHQNIAGSEIEQTVRGIFRRNNIDYTWDGTQERTIEIGELDPNGGPIRW